MTMDISKEHVEYLASALESHVVTYHTAARDLGIHVAKSKTMLLSYYLANKSRVTASFIATGTRKNGLVVRLFETETDLTENCALTFDTVHTVHVYCLLLIENSFLTAEIALEERKHQTDVSKLASYHALGLIKGPELKKGQLSARNSVSGGASSPSIKEPAKASKSTDEKSGTAAEASEKTEKPKLAYQSRKQQPTNSLLSNYVSRKGERNTKVNALPASKRPLLETPLFEYKSRKLEKLQPKERVVLSSVNVEDEPADEPMDEAPAAKPAITETELNNLFLDDDFTDDDAKNGDGADDMEVDQPIVVEHAEDENDDNIDSETQSLPTQTPLLPKDDVWKSMRSNSPAPTPAAPEKQPESETTVDEDGYFTLYKKPDPKPEPSKKPARQPVKPAARAAKPTKKNDGKKKQASVMSFFQKR
ncbi:DNA polymerase delta subunit 3 [Metschnikowia aff. pulcherrima]|uniref:DNA polymerase delta subunit 3 n=1 Tax=Metschnikowia aff. pulcherrima TaxID=2163413 RepID=A0A4P6XVJ4_9ASCO|nr:DNA polymerase delta subunit 3 [Metschnikowia aff. pulcherrima]